MHKDSNVAEKKTQTKTIIIKKTCAENKILKNNLHMYRSPIKKKTLLIRLHIKKSKLVSYTRSYHITSKIFLFICYIDDSTLWCPCPEVCLKGLRCCSLRGNPGKCFYLISSKSDCPTDLLICLSAFLTWQPAFLAFLTVPSLPDGNSPSSPGRPPSSARCPHSEPGRSPSSARCPPS